MSPKAKPTTPRWAILNEQTFALNEAENEIINRHNQVWADHCEDSKGGDLADLNSEWVSIVNDSEHGFDEALQKLKTFGSEENYTRYRRAELTGKSRKFHREHCHLFTETHAIAKRARERFQDLLKVYREANTATRKVLGLGPAANDDATSLLERLIAECSKVENYTPSSFEIIGNHVALVQIDE